jgi:hypothetical protein
MLIVSSFSHNSVKHKILQFGCPVGSLIVIFRVGHRFYSPKIARLLAEWKEVRVYSITYEFSESIPPSGPFFSASSSRKSRDLTLFLRQQYIIRVGLVRLVKGKKDSASPW